MALPAFKLAFVLPFLFCISQSGRSETIEDRLAWPPVFKRSYGTPKVTVKQVKSSKPKVVFLRPGRLVTVKTRDCSEKNVNRMLRDYFLWLFWKDFLDDKALSENELRLNMGELIPISKATFCRIGHCQLSGRSTGNRVLDAWWKVRTGGPLRESCDYLLAVINLEWDDPDEYSHGHFAFALRKRCGDTSTDSVFDFRAPWYEDRRPRVTEAPNIHNVLKLKAYQENLYDWLYTQTEYRNSHVNLSFLKVHEEQVTLLFAYNERVHEAGNFRVFKKNCASLGIQFVNRILPIDVRIAGENSFADLPRKAQKSTIETFGGSVAELRIENRTLESGRQPTSKSQLHPAKPNRKGSRPFRILCEVSEIN